MSFSGNVDVGVELDVVDFGAHEAERLPAGLDLDSRPLARTAQLAARREASAELRPYFAQARALHLPFERELAAGRAARTRVRRLPIAA